MRRGVPALRLSRRLRRARQRHAVRQLSSIRLRFDSTVIAETVFLDRDGVLVRDRPDYVKSWAEVEIVPGSFEALGRLSSAGTRVFVATNQSAVGRGIVPRGTVDEMHARLAELAIEHGGRIAGFLVCPHRPEDKCACRKPKPGLLFQAQREYGVDLGSACMVGDKLSDALAAVAAGCDAILVGDQPAEVTRRYRVAPTLPDAVDLILETGRLDS
jgi:D-glycero-D-manno-heptose 1,7-bisphosphate phosphatase